MPVSGEGICIFGEVLFDHFPDGSRVLGGAPFNVAWHLRALGENPAFISRVGDDVQGDEVRSAMQSWGMRTDMLQNDADLPTGRVSVSFGAGGEPAYDIVHPCAYDAIAEVAGSGCSLLYHGTLALRNATSRHALAILKKQCTGTVFVDVNLRPPWWQRDDVLEMVRCADWVKINHDELAALDSEATVQSFITDHMLHGLVLTHGAAGAEVVMAAGERVRVQPQQNITVVDSVGAGDAFAAVMILGLASRWPLAVTAERAQQFASAIVGQRGATVHDPAFYRPFIETWELGHV